MQLLFADSDVDLAVHSVGCIHRDPWWEAQVYETVLAAALIQQVSTTSVSPNLRYLNFCFKMAPIWQMSVKAVIPIPFWQMFDLDSCAAAWSAGVRTEGTPLGWSLAMAPQGGVLAWPHQPHLRTVP